ncbi:MAG TPA: hypothetical protein VFI20_09465 [Terracidiphilus sp.]|nr:hypothetical protein [Terracidiphilus sp.]
MIDAGEAKIQVHGSLLRIARIDGEKFLFSSDPVSLIQKLRQAKERIDLFTFIQRPSETTPKYKYPMEWDNLAVLPISTYDHWWNHQIGFKARNKARQAEKKGVVIREVPFNDELVHGIWEIYNETPIRQGRKFPHYGKDLETVHREEATYLDRSVFLGAYLGERLIGFIKLLWDFDGSQAGLLNIVSLIEQRDKAPTNGLVAQAVRSCADRHTPFLVYSNFSYGKRDKDSVSDFKERNAFQRVDVPRYFIPLTPLGLVAFKLGLHKRLSDRIPARMVEQLRSMRRSWFDKQMQSAPEGN